MRQCFFFAQTGLRNSSSAPYGSEIRGSSDQELHSARRVFGASCQPSAGQRPLTSLLLLERDPCYSDAASPIVRHEEAWIVQAKASLHCLSYQRCEKAGMKLLAMKTWKRNPGGP
ncbi:unnamed protein product [Prorocentrum cordatum]|uniref:Uncharacterized protein n=1 Tax=Prorocentrum cordatum TaxID=2364126 RepID=A0ABN9T8P7_9DINO|nr:unnamed protein product [Polarella glacialis]